MTLIADLICLLIGHRWWRVGVAVQVCDRCGRYRVTGMPWAPATG